ncbi:hypothetical protein AMS68_000144 [Peltaster fructicola]|uniref:Uncharacterized protein n=1 Tax=Peltaster fructicola TaxID=286661 RepID=A0A6H0XIS5_9PEZI|nr:hypothetical protein AMS68_000144 [Peltaster fructicola]
MSNEVVLYDLPSTGKCACWSLNPWKTRAALNFKSAQYKTEWTEYPDIEPKFKSLGIPANDPSHNPVKYSIPAVRMPDGRLIMDSRAIADALEEIQPSPSLKLNNGYVDRTQKTLAAVMTPLRPEIMPNIPALLPERSAEYFERTREQQFGMPLAALAKSDRAGDAAWKAAEPHIPELEKLLKENDGPFIAGKEPSYADFIVGGFWIFLQKANKKLYERLTGYSPAFDEHWRAVSKWFERDDH